MLKIPHALVIGLLEKSVWNLAGNFLLASLHSSGRYYSDWWGKLIIDIYTHLWILCITIPTNQANWAHLYNIGKSVYGSNQLVSDWSWLMEGIHIQSCKPGQKTMVGRSYWCSYYSCAKRTWDASKCLLNNCLFP